MKADDVHITLFSSGYCTAKKAYVFPGSGSGRMIFHATWALIAHPYLGYILFDTGYSWRFHHATRYLPYRLYRWATPVNHHDRQSCISQLKAMQIAPEEISHVVVSHFHADHIGGLADFTQASVWCKREALSYVQGKSSIAAVFRGILPQLIPKGLALRAIFPEEVLQRTAMSGLTMWPWLEGICFVDLPGHFPGQLGLYIRQSNLGGLLLCADAAWSADAVMQRRYPAKIVSLISHHYHTLTDTMDSLHGFMRIHPEIRLLTSHGQETLQLVHHESRL